MAKGDYIAFLDHDDTITPDALYEMMAMEQKMGIDSTRAVMFYSDEDKMNEEKTCYYEPHFKPDYNLDLLCANNYITHFLMVSRVLLEEVGGIQGEFNGAQDYDFILRCTEKAENVVHIPKVLYHWRVHNASTSGGVEARTMHFRQVEEPLSSIYKELENTERYNAHRILVLQC